MKVISFSLWGDKSIYQVGSIRNAKMAKEFYSDFIYMLIQFQKIQLKD